MSLRDSGQMICALSELADPGALEFSIGEGEWPLRGFVVHYRGEIRAYRNSCPHLGWTLNLKPHAFFAPHVELLQCAGHGALFEPHTGRCVAGPCIGRNLHALVIDVQNGNVYLRDQSDTI